MAEEMLVDIEDVSTEKVEILYKEFHGIKVPYRASNVVSVVQGDGSAVPKPIEPPYIRHLNATKPNLEEFVTSACKEILLEVTRQRGMKISGFEAPVAVSSLVPADSYVIQNQRVVLNEAWAMGRAIDADGDRTLVALPQSEWTHAIDDDATLVKFPITKTPVNLRKLDYIPAEKFFDLTEDIYNQNVEMVSKHRTPFNWEASVLKGHKDVPIGILTSNFNAKALYEATKIKHLAVEEIGKYLMSDPMRYATIELDGLKSLSKTDKTYQESSILDYPRTLDVRSAPFLTSTNSITRMRPDQVHFILKEDLEKRSAELDNFKIGFKDVKKSTKENIAPEPLRMYDGHIVSRLLNKGILRYEEYASFREDLPPSVLVWLQIPNGKRRPTNAKDAKGNVITVPDGRPVSLTDVKRESSTVDELTFGFLLSPVFDAEQGKFVHPLNHMNKVLAYSFDSRIINPETGDTVRHFLSQGVADLKNPKYEVKVAMLQKAITEYCGRYGDSVPATWVQGQIIPTEMALATTTMSVVIDHMKDSNEFEMAENCARAFKITPICSAGTKSKDRRVRKYALAYEDGRPVWAPKGCHYARAGKQRAQLQRAVKQCKMKVAVVLMSTGTQILITPSGAEKQHIDKVFLPEVSNVEHPDFENQHDYLTLSGRVQRCWTRDARRCIKIGKLIDQMGNKFMPRPTTQARTTSGENIDLLFPLPELLAKEAEIPFMKGGEWQQIEITSQEFEDGVVKFTQHFKVWAYVVERTFWRTGAASENIPSRFRQALYKNVDGIAITAIHKEIGGQVERGLDFTFANELKEATKLIVKKFRLPLELPKAS
jgi:hypothetical protein